MGVTSLFHRVLLVDDDVDTLEALSALLEEDGVTVHRAASAFAALRMLQAEPRPCLMLLDVRMPGMGGWELWGWMQRDPTLAGIPVVMVSGMAQDRDAARARGVRDVLHKPVDPVRLRTLVTQYCESH